MLKKLNPIIHSELRLAIISYLVANGKSDFNELKELTKATSGNLSVQLKKIEEAEYITITKGHQNNYQHTAVEITPKGLEAFDTYVNAIKKYLGN